ncbi:hypothetical protein [Piscirickettsia litoralis]|uniref:hypothetical protein n=1 Tax=Piscirickettsia litoralis TaxID=1891921 RepID=UPI001112E27F|nr:hypothetical protein [Piscirickettsia litoralis]
MLRQAHYYIVIVLALCSFSHATLQWQQPPPNHYYLVFNNTTKPTPNTNPEDSNSPLMTGDAGMGFKINKHLSLEYVLLGVLYTHNSPLLEQNGLECNNDQHCLNMSITGAMFTVRYTF